MNPSKHCKTILVSRVIQKDSFILNKLKDKGSFVKKVNFILHCLSVK